MKSLYITSVEQASGKTAVCLSLAKRFQADGFNVGYLKPLSLLPKQEGDKLADQDASFVIEALKLNVEPWELSPVVVTPNFLRERLTGESNVNLLEKVKESLAQAGAGKDVVLVEGGGSLREGFVLDLPATLMPTALDSKALMVVKYRDDFSLLDDILAAQDRLGDRLSGMIINRVPAQASAFVTNTVAPYMERRSIPVFGVLPEVRALAALTVGEIVDALGAQVLTRFYRPNAVVQNLTVGAMNADAALSRFRQQTQKAVITGGDRIEIQLIALETSTTCLILTGNLPPSSLVLKQAEEFGVAVLLAPASTIETIERIERIYGKTRLGQPNKLRQFQTLLESNVNFARLYETLGL